MKKSIVFMLATLVGGCFFASCQQLDDQVEPVEETYTKAFIKEFGLIDKNQDWNMATRGSVTVTTASATEVKIYAKTDDTYRIVGDYENVSGTQTLEFDIPRGITDILVSANGVSKQASVGQTVSFSSRASRAIKTNDGTSTNETPNPLGVKVETTNLYRYFNENDKTQHTGVYEYANTLPEKNRNVDKVTDNFEFTTGENEYSFVLYPVYWQTNNTDEIGITYVKDKTRYHVPFYSIKSGDELCASNGTVSATTKTLYVEFHQTTGTDVEETDGNKSQYYSCESKKYNDSEGNEQKWPVAAAENKTYDKFSDDEKTQVKTWIEGYLKAKDPEYTCSNWAFYQTNYVYVQVDKKREWHNIDATSEASTDFKIDNTEATKFRSRGIKVTIPANTEFAFYIKPSTGNYMYTLTALNEEVAKYGGTQDEKEHVVHGATFFNNEKMRCLCFEDWHGKNDSEEPDLNDIVLYTTLATDDNPTPIVNEDPVEYILAAEDLGNMDDFDFNDIVVSVSRVAGSTTATLKALAAGGTLPVRLCYDGNAVSSPVDENNLEWHSWFGDGKIPYTSMINTSSFNESLCHSKTITVPTDFSMAQCSADATDKTKLTNMGGFSFVVDRGADGNFTKTDAIRAPMNGEAPQMICVSEGWKWPKERKNIKDAYTGFGEWGKNYTNTTWLSTAVSDLVLGPDGSN